MRRLRWMTTLASALTLMSSGILMVASSGPVDAVNGCGVPYSGTTYQLSQPNHFTLLSSCNPSWNFELIDDVDLGGVNVSRLGAFTANFDGRGFTINNLMVTGSALFDVGVAGATFRRVHFENAMVRSGSGQQALSAGALVRTSSGPLTISDSTFDGSVVAEGSDYGNVGGLVGNTDTGVVASFTDVSSTATVIGGPSTAAVAGGILGISSGTTTFADSSFSGTVTGGAGSAASAGGLVGYLYTGVVTISDSYASGTVVGGLGSFAAAGGFIGHSAGTHAEFRRSYFTGQVTGGPGSRSSAGGFVGLSLSNVIVSQSYVTGSLTGGPGISAGAGGFVGFWGCISGTYSILVDNSFTRITASGGPGGASRTGGIVGVRCTNLDLTTTITNSYGEGTLTSGPGSEAWSFALSHAAAPTVSATASFCVTVCESGGSGVGTTVSAINLPSAARAAGWDFTDVWCVSPSFNDGFPVLKGLSFGPNAAWGACGRVSPPTPVVAPMLRVTLDTDGGTCGVTSGRTTFSFIGFRYLPGASECSRVGHEFIGWARTDDVGRVVALPSLVDPSDGVKRYFVTENLDLIAVWKKAETETGEEGGSELDDLSGTAPGSFVGGPDRRTREGGGVVDGYYIPPGTRFWPWMLAR